MWHFTIRDMLWLTVVVAVGLSFGIGWWRQHVLAKNALEDLRAAQEARVIFEQDAKDLGNMFDTFGDPMPQNRMNELRKKYIENRLP